MSTQQGPSSPKNKSNTVLKPILWGVAFVGAILLSIFISPYFAILAVALVIGGLALDAAQPASRKITPRFLKKLLEQPEAKREKAIATLNNTLRIQWLQNPTLFKKNFETLKDYPDIIKALGSDITTVRGVATEGDNLMTVLIDSPNQIASPNQKKEALQVILDIVRPTINVIKNSAEVERIVLNLIRNGVMANNEDFVQALIEEWPNTDLNNTNFQRNYTLLTILIQEGAPYEKIRLLLDLKTKGKQPLVDPNCLVNNGKLTPLQIALIQNPPNEQVAMLLKQYGATDYGTLPLEQVNAFEERYKLKSVPPHAEKTNLPTQPSVEKSVENKLKNVIAARKPSENSNKF